MVTVLAFVRLGEYLYKVQHIGSIIYPVTKYNIFKGGAFIIEQLDTWEL
jgi:hypothetical protein